MKPPTDGKGGQVKRLGRKLSYSNATATLALFIALGSASYAAVQLPADSVGTRQLRNEAVSSAKLRSGAVRTAKIANGAVTGAKVDAGSLGTVPSAIHALGADLATEAGHARRADSASLAAKADVADDAARLGGIPANAYGAALAAHTEIPATNVDVEVWVPVNGLGQPSSTLNGVEMLTPTTTPLFGSGFTAMSKTGPGPEDDARVLVQLFHDGEPVAPSLKITRLAYAFWQPEDGVKVEAGGRLAVKVTEEANGEEVPALGLQTSLLFSPSP